MEEMMWLTSSAGVSMPPIIYGTAWKKERTADLVVKAIEAGFAGIDTAGQPKHYEEALVGQALQRLGSMGVQRRNLFLQTKFTPISGQDPNRLPYDRDAPVEQQVVQSLEMSKSNLQTDYIDSFILHSPLVPHALMLEAWQAMENLHKDGSVRQLGISNCYNLEVLQSLYDDTKVKPAVVQNRFYEQTGYDKDLRIWCGEVGIIYQSFWTLTANEHILSSDIVAKIGRQHGKTGAQVFFRYLTQTGIVPLTGTTSGEHMHQDLTLFDFKLSQEEMTALSLLLE